MICSTDYIEKIEYVITELHQIVLENERELSEDEDDIAIEACD